MSKKDDEADYGLQPDGSVKANRQTDFAFSFLCGLNWNRPLKNTTSSKVWSDPEEYETSMAFRHMNYETDSSYINLDDPSNYGLIEDLRKLESRKIKNKDKIDVKEFTLNHQKVTEVKGNGETKDDEDDGDFMDEFGNIKETETIEEEAEVKAAKEEPMDKNYHKDLDQVGGIRKQKVRTKFSFQLEEPRFSFLSVKEQKMYIQLLEKFRRGELDPTKDQKNFNVFTTYKEIVKDEQQEFQAFVKDLFHDSFPTSSKEIAAKYLKPQAKVYAEENISYDLARVPADSQLKPVGRLDTPDSMLRMLPLSNEQQEKAQFEMRLIKPLLEIGDVWKMVFPTFDAITDPKNPLKLCTNYKKVSARYPTGQSNKRQPSLAKDPNILALGSKFLPDVIICPSAIKCIFENFAGQLTHCWEIPFSTKALGSKTVIIVEKPLPKKSWSALEKSRMFMRKAIKSSLIHPWTHNQKSSANRQGQSLVDYTDPFNDADVDLSVLETFGKDIGSSQVDGANDDSDSDGSDKMVIDWQSPPCNSNRVTRSSAKNTPESRQHVSLQPKKRKSPEESEENERSLAAESDEEPVLSPKKKISRLEESGDEEETKDDKKSNVLDDILKQSATERFKRRSGGRGRGRGRSRGRGLLGNIMSAQSSMLGKGQSKGPFQPPINAQPFQEKMMFVDPAAGLAKDFSHPHEDQNISHNLWYLKPKDQRSKDPPVVVLTRSSIHCQTKGPNDQAGDRFTLSCKPEFQAQLGCEVMTKSELSQEWISTLIRPCSKLARVRVDADTQEILTVERKTLKDLSNDGAAIGFKPGELLGNLYTLFRGLVTKLPNIDQDYLLVHDAETGPFVKVLQINPPTDESKTTKYSEPSVDAPTIHNWLPIDVNVITPRHKIKSKVPGLFTPRKFDNSPDKSFNKQKGSKERKFKKKSM